MERENATTVDSGSWIKSFLADEKFSNVNQPQWIRNETLGHISHDIPSPLRQAFVDFQEQRERERTSIKEAKEMIDRYISDTLNGTNLSFKQIFTKKYQSIYGSGNTPMSTFSWNEHPDQLTPLRQHPNDPDFPEESPTMLSDWKPKPNLLANLIPFEVHYDHTMEMLTPQNLNTFGSSGDCQVQEHRARYKLLPAFVDPNQTIQGNPNNITVSNTLNGLPHHFIPAAAESGDAIKLHTHCVAEVGKRREDGGGACVNCGLWEDRLAEAQHQGNTAMKNIGGVLTGDSIGIGRISVGNLCLECTTNMTCISCNASTPPLPRIPTAVELPDPEFLQMICTRNKYTDTCVDCDEKQEHAGNYGGWDKMLSEEKGPRPHYFETDSDSEIDGDISTWNSLDDFENGDGMESRSDNYQLISDAEYKKKTSTANSASSTSKCFPSSSQESEESYDFIEQDPDSDPLNSSLTSRLHQLIHDPRIILSTRVTEKCDGCNDLLCSFCLNYDVDLGTKIYEATEYQECAGKCGLRICKSCLHGEEFVRVWCYEQCGAWLCPLCTYGKRDVVFVCHPGSRGERWEWGRGEFLPFMWWTCRYLGIRHCNSKNKTKNDNESKTEDMSKVDNRPEGSNMLED
ncbi:hypothetical protein C7212DRAFT_366241 [Tuber magnatum]|uniref:Zinc-finger domain-containing protein n=1 Tax=Tuber magnatum TaxID=42249 RepID=A0A317SIG5_9PEZI|nr:hypothetical protein C7212DRAFT_366241 [Tuber magnatum]